MEIRVIHFSELHLNVICIFPERKTVPSFSKPLVPSSSSTLMSTDSKLSTQQSPPTSPIKPSLEVRLFPQPYTQPRMFSPSLQVKKVEPPVQSPVKLKPKVVSVIIPPSCNLMG